MYFKKVLMGKTYAQRLSRTPENITRKRKPGHAYIFFKKCTSTLKIIAADVSVQN